MIETAPTAAELRARKGGRRLAMLTAYDYPTALALDAAGLDILLVGDSMGEVELGYGSTRAVTPGDDGPPRAGGAQRGPRDPRLRGPHGRHATATPGEAVRSARVLVEAGADSVKLEGGLIDAGARDHRRRDPGDGPRGAPAPDGRGLPPRGHDARRGRPHRRRGPRPRRGRRATRS